MWGWFSARHKSGGRELSWKSSWRNPRYALKRSELHVKSSRPQIKTREFRKERWPVRSCDLPHAFTESATPAVPHRAAAPARKKVLTIVFLALKAAPREIRFRTVRLNIRESDVMA